MKTTLWMLAAAVVAGNAFAKLPDPTPEAVEAAAAKKAQADHGNKVGAYKLCLSQNATAARYLAGKGKKAEAAACADPGPFVPPTAAKS